MFGAQKGMTMSTTAGLSLLSTEDLCFDVEDWELGPRPQGVGGEVEVLLCQGAFQWLLPIVDLREAVLMEVGFDSRLGVGLDGTGWQV